MNKLLAFCGLDCSRCEGYLATQANDDQAKQRVVEKWRKDFDAPDMTLQDVTCDGCLAFAGRLGGYCHHCQIRACGIERKLLNCAECGDFESCEKLTAFHRMAPQARANLMELRHIL